MDCQCSNIPSNLKIIRVGDSEVGLFDLRKTLRAVYRQGIEDETKIKKELLQRIKEKNSIPQQEEEMYAEALVREYHSFAKTQKPVKKEISQDQMSSGRVSVFLKRIFGKR
ncbi:hypothetical protein KGY73_11435 [bacterium]|nr:hypothetical protein [bacterium]